MSLQKPTRILNLASSFTICSTQPTKARYVDYLISDPYIEEIKAEGMVRTCMTTLTNLAGRASGSWVLHLFVTGFLTE